MTDFVKLFLKQKNRGFSNNENFGSSSFFKGGPVGFCFALWKKSDWFLPLHNIKKWEKVWFFSKPEKNVLHDHFGKGVKHETKKLIFQKKLNEPKTCMSLKIEFLGRGRVPEKNKMCSGKLSQFLIWLTKLFSANQSLRPLKSTPLGFPINPPRLYILSWITKRQLIFYN